MAAIVRCSAVVEVLERNYNRRRRWDRQMGFELALEVHSSLGAETEHWMAAILDVMHCHSCNLTVEVDVVLVSLLLPASFRSAVVG